MVRIIVGMAITKPIVTMSKRTPMMKACVTSHAVVSPTRSRFKSSRAVRNAKYIANSNTYSLKVILTKTGIFFIVFPQKGFLHFASFHSASVEMTEVVVISSETEWSREILHPKNLFINRLYLLSHYH